MYAKIVSRKFGVFDIYLTGRAFSSWQNGWICDTGLHFIAPGKITVVP